MSDISISIWPYVTILGIGMGLLLLQVVTVVIFRSWHLRAMGIVIACIVPAVQLLLFYSLAAHMYEALGGWPKFSGEGGFPPLLLVHSTVTAYWTELFALLTLFAWPSALLVFIAAPKLRQSVGYPGLYILSTLICVGAMSLGPDSFLAWFRD